MLDLGTVRPGSTIRIPFSSFDKDDGSSITMTNYAVADILVYKDGSTTERASTAGFTATTDFDGKTGKHLAIIDLSDNTTSGFWNAGSEYLVAIDAVTVDAVTTGGWIARFRIGYPSALIDTTIATLSSQTSFTLTTGPAEDDALNNHYAIIHDIASAVQLSRVLISDYVGSTKTITLAAGATFTAAAGDNISILYEVEAVRPTVAGRTLDVSTGGEAGIDWANVGSQSTSVNLSATTTNLCNTITTYTGNTVQTGDAFARIGAAGAGLTALGDTRVANLDATVSSRSTLTQTQVTGGAYALNNASFAFNSAVNNAIADQVWDEVLSGHLTGGTTGNALNAAGSAGDPWSTALPGAYSSGTAGHIIGTAIPDVAAGSNGGLLKVGSNAATTFASVTCAGTFTIAGGVAITQSNSGVAALSITGHGTTGDAVYISTTKGHALHLSAAGDDKYAIYGHCGLTGNTVVFECNPNASAATLADRGHGLAIYSADGTTNGNAILLRALYHGCGIFAKAGDNEAAFHLQGGTTGPAIRLWPGTGGSGVAPGLEIYGAANGPAISAVGGYTGNGGTQTQACSAVAITNKSTVSGSTGLSLTSYMGSALDVAAIGTGSKAVNIYSLYSHAINIDTNGPSSHGVNISGGNSGTSDGVRINAGTGGVGLRLGSLTVTGTSTLTGAVSLGSTLGVTGTTTLAALAITGTTTATGVVTFTNGLAANITGNITGNLSGTVGSVTGNVGGNVVGTVASVVGAVGSVTGNVGGNVTGSVGSVAGNITGNVTGSIVTGTVTTGASTTSIPTSALSPSATVADQFKGRVVIFDKTTATAALRGQASDITASTSGGTLTVTALTTAAAAGDTFVIV